MTVGVVKRELAGALARVDLSDREEQLAGNLSHGEKRQLEVGMALVGKPQLLLLDEPMAGQGAGGTVELKKLILGLKGQTTILLVEHDMSLVMSVCDRIHVLDFGSVIARGTPEEIQRNQAVLEAYLGGAPA